MLIDALPYYDQGYDDPGARDHAVALIQEEMMLYKPTKDYLQHFPLPDDKFETQILKNEMDRMTNSQPMESINMKRYELPEPATGLRTDVDAWRLSVENSQAQ
ncbi:Pre-mRNA-splicing factor SPF27-like, partial [Oopsacas minuta]